MTIDALSRTLRSTAPRRRFPLRIAGAFLATALAAGAAEAQDPSCVPPPEGLFAWWPLDDPAGAAAALEVIDGADALYLGNPVTVPGMVGDAVRLDGDGDCLEALDDGFWDFGTGPFTFEFWVSFDTEPSGSSGQPGDVLFAHSEGPFNVDKYLFALAPSQLEFIVGSAALDTSLFAPVTPFAPVVGEWHHLALTRSGTQYSVWIDGELADTETGFANMPDAVATLAIGCVQEFWGGFLEGRLDEFSIYDRALTAGEIASIFEAGSAGKCRDAGPTTTTTSTTTTTLATTTSTTTTTLATTTSTTTTTLPPTTSTTTTTPPTTSTTLPAFTCGDANGDDKVSAVDALVILKAAVGGGQCDAEPCLCNIDGNASVGAADALAALKIAVGQAVPRNCPC